MVVCGGVVGAWGRVFECFFDSSISIDSVHTRQFKFSEPVTTTLYGNVTAFHGHAHRTGTASSRPRPTLVPTVYAYATGPTATRDPRSTQTPVRPEAEHSSSSRMACGTVSGRINSLLFIGINAGGK